ncbi:Histone deacetylase hda1 [Serendipita sp. 399]|nr:Histone deacetylase hda1 [Serendipita sp. 399]
MEIDPPAPTGSASRLLQPFASLSKPNVRRATSNPPEKPERVIKSTRTGYVYDVAMMTHVHPTEDHPETPQRISVIYQEMRIQRLLKDAVSLFFRPVERHQALLVHSEDHWDKVERIAFMTTDDILASVAYYEGLSLYVSPHTTTAAKLSCGGVIEACRSVVTGAVRNSFAIVRPPGHHAEPDEHMGFCFFNNAAVAARVMQVEGKAKRVLILDWDVHHGNGTQKAFLDDPTVLYISLHRYDDGTFYPGGHFGSLTSCGEGPGLGFSVNIAWPEGDMGDAEYLYAFQRVIMPIAMEFAPDLVIVSAGFDAARGDDLGGCDVTPGGYAHMTHMLSSLAEGRIVVALEGGYNLESIRDSAVAVMRVLLGEAPPSMSSMIANKKATETVYQALRVQSKYWKSIVAPPHIAGLPSEPVETIHLPSLIKEYRSRQLYLKHQLHQLPIVDDVLKQAFTGLVLCSMDIFRVSTLILFIHNFGDLHVELMGEASCDVNLEKSFIMDASTEFIAWARQNGYGVIDLNVFANPLANQPKDTMREALALQRRVITYVWDNFIEIAEEASVYLVAYGGASFSISELFKARDVTNKLKGVAQIVGKSQVPAQVTRVIGSEDWFVKNSVVYTGVDNEDNALFGSKAGIGRIERLSPIGATHLGV